MSGIQDPPWSTNPNAPNITHEIYFAEKANFAGILIGAILYGTPKTLITCTVLTLSVRSILGIVIVLFFHCMAALFNPINRRREGIKWSLVSYTAVMFSFVTIFTAMNLNIQSISYIDNREFPGVDGVLPPGPLGYQWSIYSNVLTIVPNLMFVLNNWLADGLLVGRLFAAAFTSFRHLRPLLLQLYRCYVIYAGNLWVIAFPCLMFLASVGTYSSSPQSTGDKLWADIINLAMGILFLYQTSQPNSSIWNSVAINFGLPYFSISVSLNVLLTLMIVTRLVMHSRNIRTAMGAPAGIGGLYKTIITMLIESSALYAANSLLFVGPWGAGSHIADIFLPILAEVQVRVFPARPWSVEGSCDLTTRVG